ncbi:MAG: EamA family transporter [Patescibacteria group bacterium]
MWLLFALLAAVTAAIMTIVAKIGLKGIDPTFATGVRSAFMFLFMACVVLVSGKLKGLTTLDQKSFWIIVASAIFGALSWLFYFLALRDASASKVAAIDRLSLVFVILFSVLFLADKLTIKLALGGVLTTIGIILIALG